MAETQGEFRGGPSGGYAKVHLGVELSEDDFEVSINLDDSAWNEQLRAGGFRDWLEAAQYGVSYALRLARCSHGKWQVRCVVGLICDTTPGRVAYAAAVAVWAGLDFEPPEGLLQRMDEVARSSGPSLVFPE